MADEINTAQGLRATDERADAYRSDAPEDGQGKCYLRMSFINDIHTFIKHAAVRNDENSVALLHRMWRDAQMLPAWMDESLPDLPEGSVVPPLTTTFDSAGAMQRTAQLLNPQPDTEDSPSTQLNERDEPGPFNCDEHNERNTRENETVYKD